MFLIRYRHFGIAWFIWPLKMGQTGWPETSDTNHQSTPPNTPQGRRPQVVCSFHKIKQTQKTTILKRSRLFTNTGWHKKTGTFEKPNKNWRNQRKKLLKRNWTITTCLLRESNPNYQCLKITSCRWRPPPRMHSFTATMHFKFPVLLCHPVWVACSAECDSVAFCRACKNAYLEEEAIYRT